ncbi:MAG: metal ABC transporter ATP-binding protein [Actinomycetota bacterium]
MRLLGKPRARATTATGRRPSRLGGSVAPAARAVLRPAHASWERLSLQGSLRAMFGGQPTGDESATGPARLSSSPSVVFDGVDVRRGSRLALRGVTFALQPGTVTSIVGPNGAGKSSLLGALSGRLPLSSGTVRVDGEVAEVLQSTQIDPHLHLTVEDVVRIARYPSRGLFRPMRARDREIIHKAMAACDVRGFRRRSIHELSGGQRQRVLVAQALAQQAPVLLLDEPTTGLDRQSQRHLLRIIRDEADRGTTVLVATHNLSEAEQADNMIVLACDCLCCAPPSTALADPAVTALFETTPSFARSA